MEKARKAGKREGGAINTTTNPRGQMHNNARIQEEGGGVAGVNAGDKDKE